MEDNFDFFKYAGIHRSVVLYTTPKNYIDDITVTTALNGTNGSVSFSIDTIGQAGEVSVSLVDKNGDIVAFADGNSNTLIIPNAKIWWPYTMAKNKGVAAGYLYTLKVLENEPLRISFITLRCGFLYFSGYSELRRFGSRCLPS